MCTCRRFLRNVDDAEDATQSTFLTLIKKGSKLKARDSLAPWLHHVAKCISINLRQSRTVRQRRERTVAKAKSQAVALARPSDSASRHEELFALVEEEIDRLPHRDRTSLVLFHLEQKSHAEIASCLGCSIDVAKHILSRARRKVSKRLRRQGVVLPASGVGTLLTGGAEGPALSSELARVVSESATKLLRGETPVSISPTVARLIETPLPKDGRMRGRFGLACAAALVLAALLGALLAYRSHRLQGTDANAPIRELSVHILKVTGDSAELKCRGGDAWSKASAGMRLNPGDTVRTGSDSEMVLRLERRGSVLMREASELTFHREAGSFPAASAAKLELRRGALVCDISEARSPIGFSTPHASIRAEDARFFLMVAEARKAFTRMDLTKGHVKLPKTSKHEPRILNAGQAFCIGTAVEPRLMPSDGQEFSPKYGGILFRQCAGVYDVGGYCTDRLSPTPVRTLGEWDGERLMAVVLERTGASVDYAGKGDQKRSFLKLQASGKALRWLFPANLEKELSKCMAFQIEYRIWAPSTVHGLGVGHGSMNRFPFSRGGREGTELNPPPIRFTDFFASKVVLFRAGRQPDGRTVYEELNMPAARRYWQQGRLDGFSVDLRKGVAWVQWVRIRELRMSNASD